MKTIDEYAIIYNGKIVSHLNLRMVERQKLTDETVEKIKKLHVKKLELHEDIRSCDSIDLKIFAIALTDVEFELQELWGFPQDSKFHRFWETPRCQCPRMDNEDIYPSKYAYMNMDCPLHGS